MKTPDLVRTDRKDSAGRDIHRLVTEYRHQIGPNAYVVVPADYETNLGTVPRIFTWFVGSAELREASVVHDYMCNEDFVDDGKPIRSGWSRWMADAVFYEVMADMGFGWFRRSTIFAGVRVWAIVTGQK